MVLAVKKLTLFVFVFFMIVSGVKAQLVVELGALTQGIMERTRLERVFHYLQMIQEDVKSAVNTYNQVQAMIRAEERALSNLAGITNVDSYGDFMNWYNRQLDLERNVEDRFNNLGITIGGSRYSLADIGGIRDGLSDTYSDYWENEFTEEQRRAMWTGLGLTPANYVYQSTWAARQEDLAEWIMTGREITSEDNRSAYEKQGEILANTSGVGVGEKAVLQGILSTLMSLERAIRDGNSAEAAFREYQYAREQLEKTPRSRPPDVSGLWNQTLFEPLTEEEGRFIERY